MSLIVSENYRHVYYFKKFFVGFNFIFNKKMRQGIKIDLDRRPDCYRITYVNFEKRYSMIEG